MNEDGVVLWLDEFSFSPVQNPVGDGPEVQFRPSGRDLNSALTVPRQNLIKKTPTKLVTSQLLEVFGDHTLTVWPVDRAASIAPP